MWQRGNFHHWNDRAQEVKKHYEEELSEARSNFEKIKSELEHLRESNDLLKKMSKIIVESMKIKIRVLSCPTFAAVTANKRVANNQNNRNPPINNSKLYCHYFNNSINCSHGNKCKFLHSKATFCYFHANSNINACSSTPKKALF